MKTWSTIRRLLFLGLLSVYPVSGLLAAPENKASDAQKPEVRLLNETAGPIAQSTPPAAPSTQPAGATASQVAVTEAGTVEIHVSEANLNEVLRMLSLQSQRNIIASKDVRGSVTANLYNVTIREALDAILKSNGMGYREKGNFIYVYTAKELADIEKSERQTQTEVFRLYYTPAANAVNMVKPVLSADGQVAFSAAATVGIDAAAKDSGGNSHATYDVIVIRDYPENLERARKVIKEVDRRPQQILVEATIVAATLREDNALGIDFAILGGVDFTGVTKAGMTSIPDALSGKVLNTNLPEKGFGGANTGFTQGMSNKGLRVGIVTNNVAVFISALEEVTDTAVLANPKVLTLNKQRGEVLVGKEDGYITTTFTESTSVQTVQFLQTGTRLIFRPFVADDGFIRMEVHPEDSDGKVVNGLPSKTTTEVTTNVMVKDGHTIVIGGLFRESSTKSRSQVPGLGNLPVVGPLFRQQADSTSREEIIILLTPHIIKDESIYSAASEREIREFDKLRAGVRRGMMPWGRERLAEWSYDNAAREMSKAKPDRCKVEWFLDCATNLNPTFREAISMKENVTGRQITTVDNSSIRYFVKRQILEDRGAAPATEPAPVVPIIPGKTSAMLAPAPAPSPAPLAVPATQPVAITPATQPTAAAPATQPIAAAPATQPAAAQVTLLEETEPEAPAMAECPAPTPLEKAAPATQPARKGENASVVVTELPADDAESSNVARPARP